MAKMRNEPPPLCFSLANFVVFNRIKAALGLDQAKLFLYGAAPIKPTTVDYFASLDIIICGAYGLSETTGGLTL